MEKEKERRKRERRKEGMTKRTDGWKEERKGDR